MAIDIDTNHALFVRQEYRYAVEKDNAVKANNDSARDITIESNLEQEDAEAIAQKILAENVAPRVFEIELEGVISLASFIGGPPSFLADLPQYDYLKTAKVISATPNLNTGTTVVQVRG